MIEYYGEAKNREELRKLNDELYELIAPTLDPIESSAEYVVEDHLFRRDPVKYQNIIYGLVDYIKDEFIHELGPIHQYILYNILQKSIEITKDIIRFEEGDLRKYFIKNLDILDGFIETFFEDHDFNVIKIYFEAGVSRSEEKSLFC